MSASASAPAGGVFASPDQGPWLFGRNADLMAFGGSALLSVLLVSLGAALGLLDRDTPDSLWLACIVAVDVAHVWSTLFRVYLDGSEVKRRPLLYLGLPLLCYALGVMAHAVSAAVFWRVLAYVAVYHFVRQQYGWVALYRRRARETGALDRWLDTVTIYTATVYPLIWWHGHLPRAFDWFLDGDFVTGLATPIADVLLPAYWAVLALFVARQIQLQATGRRVNAGKVLVVLTTWLCWWLGIMALDSDYAFTVTNVLIHGIPYMLLTYRFGRARAEERKRGTLSVLMRGGVVAFYVVVLVLAAGEELLWDRLVWHDRPWLFGDGPEMEGLALTLLVPVLAVPQATHYALDGFVWKVRRRASPELARELGD